jgi:hypothetical protein
MSEHNGTARAAHSPTSVAARHTAKLLRNAVSLAELQAELFKIEVRQRLAGAAKPGLLLIVAISLAIGSTPILLLSLAYFLTDVGGLPHAISLLIATVVGLTAAVAGALVALRGLAREVDLSLSKEEFGRNVAWIKDVLDYQSDTANDGCGDKRP